MSVRRLLMAQQRAANKVEGQVPLYVSAASAVDTDDYEVYGADAVVEDDEVKACGDRTINLISGQYSQFDNVGGSGTTYQYFKFQDAEDTYTMAAVCKKDGFVGTNGTYLGITKNGGEITGARWLINNSVSANKGDVIVITSTNGFVSFYTKQSNYEIITEYFDLYLVKGSYTAETLPKEPYGYKVTPTCQHRTKNLWDEEWENAYYPNGVKTTNDTVIGSKNLIPVIPNTNVYFGFSKDGESRSLFITPYDANGTFISVAGWTKSGRKNINVSGIVLIPNNVYFIRISYNVGTYSNDVIIAESSIAIPYEPYLKTDSYPFYIKCPLIKLGDACDVAQMATQSVHRGVGRLTFDDAPNVTYWTGNMFYIANKKPSVAKVGGANISDVYGIGSSANGIWFRSGQNHIYITDKAVDASSSGAAAIAAKLVGTSLYYEQTETTDEPTTMTAMSLASGTNKIDCDTAIKPSKMSVTADGITEVEDGN